MAADVPQSAPDMMQTDGYKNISKLEDMVDHLRAARDLLLLRLMSGKVQV